MKTGVILLNFGEPEHATEAEVVPFLERIFATNASLEDATTPEQVRARSHELAVRRAPGLIEEYEGIGGSPLNAQARGQAEALEAELRRRGHDAHCFVGMQFTEPTIMAAAEAARAAGVERLIALPVYPLCGPSTTVAALRDLAAACARLDWSVELLELSGWHTHPVYTAIRAEGIRTTAAAAGLDFADGRTKLVFSAHGTPMKYLAEGSRYDLYVHDSCRRIAGAAGVRDYVIGYQNHTNRNVEWTKPDIEEVIRTIRAKAVIVVPVSFMHEQSETLAELDQELREEAEEVGLAFHRVPVPHDHAQFAEVLADLTESRLRDGTGSVKLHQCMCRPDAATRCTNAVIRQPKESKE
jgi:protoporphyrin/coproporphyrin ferrochelatase